MSYLGSCDEGVEELAKLLGWEKELEDMYVKGNEKLKAIWKEQELLSKEEEEVIEKKEDEEVDLLAEELEKLTADDAVSKIADNHKKDKSRNKQK